MNFNSNVNSVTNVGGKFVSQDEVRDAHYRTNSQTDAPTAFLEAMADIKRGGTEHLKPKPKTRQLTRKKPERKPDDASLRKAAEKDLKKRNLKN